MKTRDARRLLVASVYGDDAAYSLIDHEVDTIVVWDERDMRAALPLVDAVLLTGGGDVDPSRYGEQRHPNTYGYSTQRDDLEFAVVSRAVEMGLPIMGICRGSQVLNVALGGTLNQHIPGLTGKQHGNGSLDVYFDPSSRIGHALNLRSMDTTHLHHQSVNRTGTGLRAVGWTKDGIVEAIESLPDSDLPYIIGVQFHPEIDDMYTGSDAALIFEHWTNMIRLDEPKHTESTETRERAYKQDEARFVGSTSANRDPYAAYFDSQSHGTHGSEGTWDLKRWEDIDDALDEHQSIGRYLDARHATISDYPERDDECWACGELEDYTGALTAVEYAGNGIKSLCGDCIYEHRDAIGPSKDCADGECLLPTGYDCRESGCYAAVVEVLKRRS